MPFCFQYSENQQKDHMSRRWQRAVHTLCIETVHHGLHHVQLVLDGEVDEVGVHQDVVRGAQLGVILEKQRA